MENVKISVIIPVYNAESWIEKCINSIQNSTYDNLEIICINDGSTDNSLEVLQRIANRDDRVIVETKENEGVSRARNYGMARSTGEYLMFVDADDWIEPDTCEKAVAAMFRYNADIVMWSYISETESRSSAKVMFPRETFFDKQLLRTKLHRRFIGVMGEELAHPELADSLCPVWGKLYRRSVIEKGCIRFVDLEEIGTYEDGLFNLEVFGNAVSAVYLAEYLYHYRRGTTESVTSGYRDGLYAQWQNLFRKMDSYISGNHLPQEYKDALNNRIALSILGLGLNTVSAEKTVTWKITEIRRIISQPQYRAAYQSLDYSYFPMHWKLFYGFARMRFSFGVYVLLKAVNYIISK